MRKRYALCAALGGVFLFTSALPMQAADLGGSCCSDLEERVAELEATAAKKGNRKVSVTISGQVDYAYFGLSDTSFWKKQNGVINNSASPTMLSISGQAKLDNNWKSGFSVTFQMDDRLNLTTPGLALPNEVVMREAVGWLETPVGKITLGHGSMASDKIASITTANTEVASKMLSLAPISTVALGGYDLPYNDVRRDGARFDSPILAGFILSASIANGDIAIGAPGFAAKDAWDLALRYSGETKAMGGLRFAAGVAYRDEQQTLATLAFGAPVRSTVTAGSASLMSMSTGLFVNVAAGRVTNDTFWGSFSNYQTQFGIEKNFFGFGATTLFAEYADMHIDTCKKTGCDPNMWGLGAVQNVAGLATDVYVDFKSYDTSPAGGVAFQQYMAGIRVKF